MFAAEANMRGELDQATLQGIEARLPDIGSLSRICSWTPTVTSLTCMLAGVVNSALPLAGVCLNDTLSGVEEARCAVLEARACLVWYREKSPSKPNEPAAVFTSRFYATAAASCLYASAERLADALIAMFGIDSSKLPKSVDSRQAKVAQYLITERPGDPITAAVQSLGASPDWTESRQLRNRWVHEQPPTVAGLGVQYRRRQQWIKRIDGQGEPFNLLNFGGGDEPEYSIDEMVSFVGGALRAFVCVFELVVKSYEQRLCPATAQADLGVAGS
jgi:hypothetical protein